MKKLYIMIPIFLYVILLISSTLAAVGDSQWRALCESTGGTTLVNEDGTDGTVGNSAIWQEFGKIGRGCGMRNAYNAQITLPASSSSTVALWFKLNTFVDDHLWVIQGGGETTRGLVQNSATIQVSYVVKNDWNTFTIPGSNLRAGVWYSLIVTQSGGSVNLYINDTPSANNPLLNGDTFEGATYDFGGPLVQFDGDMDMINFCDIVVTSAQRAAWHNAGAGTNVSICPVVLTETSAPTIVAPTPADNANNNTNVTLNVTHSTVNNDVRYYLYFGDSSTLTENDYYYFNVTRNGSEYSSFVTNVSVDGIYYWKYKVQNVSSGIFSANTTQRTWTLDTTNPTISFGNNNNFSIDNSTIINSYLNNLSINILFFDTNLYQTLINITNSSGLTQYQILNTSITGTTANYSRIVDISTWAVGDYTIRLSATDSHTAKEIYPYDVITRLDYFRYTTEEGNVIKIKSDTLPLTKSTTKFKDRYDFGFNYLFQKDTYKFIIESYNKIDYIKDSGYNAHFVIIGNNGKGNWIDFEHPSLSAKDYVITKIDDYTYEVEITANGLKSFTFSSLGGLNTVEEHYKFKVGAVIDVWVFDGENYPNQINATATIGAQSANSTTNVNGARLVNLTTETSLSLTSSGFGSEVKTISITNNYHNLSFNMTPVSSAKLYFYDEVSNTLIAKEIFEVYLETTGFSQTYRGINSTATNPFTITSLSDGLYKLKASSPNYLERQYLDLNISNITTTNLNIYLLNSTDGGEKIFNIVDEGLNPLEGVRVVFTKILNGTATTIAEEESDFAGQVILILNENTQYTIDFTKTNYESRIITLEPKNAKYVIKMISTIGKYNQSVYEGIRYRFEPSNMVLNNKTKYNFTFTLNSTVWDITNCTLSLKNGSSILNRISSHTSTSCFLRIEYNTGDLTNITSEARYELNSIYNFTVTQNYKILYTYKGQFSLKNFLDDLSGFGMAGFDNFGRMMLALIVIFVITALAAQKVGFTNPEVLIFLVVAQVWLFSYVNWLYLDFTPIPTIAGFDLKKYIIAILITLAGGAFVIEKFSK